VSRPGAVKAGVPVVAVRRIVMACTPAPALVE